MPLLKLPLHKQAKLQICYWPSLHWNQTGKGWQMKVNFNILFCNNLPFNQKLSWFSIMKHTEWDIS